MSYISLDGCLVTCDSLLISKKNWLINIDIFIIDRKTKSLPDMIGYISFEYNNTLSSNSQTFVSLQISSYVGPYINSIPLSLLFFFR